MINIFKIIYDYSGGDNKIMLIKVKFKKLLVFILIFKYRNTLFMFIFIFHPTSELCKENVKRSTTIETQKDMI